MKQIITPKIYNIGISCIGSGVGQSVINSLNLSRLPIKTIGLDTNPFAYGIYDCDKYEYTKSINDKYYIENLIEICLKNKIDLVIPGLDDELLTFAQNAKKFAAAGIKTIIAGEELISICRDKERMSNDLNTIVDVFVKSYDKHTLLTDIESGKVKFPFIAKPRNGSASKGIELIRCKNDLIKISKEHTIQELAFPLKTDPNYDFYISQIAENQNPQVSEVSIQLVYSPVGKLIGRMSSYNKLKNGVPIEIVPYDNDYIWSIIDQLTPVFLKMGLKGPLNIQGRLTENGLKLYDMNPRFTGITGLRALMGFNEVEACVKEWLGIDKGENALRFNYNRFGIRQIADKCLPIERNNEVLNLFKQINGGELKNKRTILITGACGYLGRNLISILSKANIFEIFAFDIDKQKTISILNNTVNEIFDKEDLKCGRLNLGNVDILLHLGFSRPHGTYQQIADSLKFTNELFARAVANQIPAIINISSQSVYGSEIAPPWTEISPVAPQSVYAQAKYSTELILEALTKTSKMIKSSSLRLGTLSGGAPGLIEIDLLSKFARSALEGKTINIVGGTQQVERFDLRDAIEAIITMLYSNPSNWKQVYNLGGNLAFSIKEIAEKTVNIASMYNDNKYSEIKIEEKNVELNFGLDSSVFYTDFNWLPKYKMEETIDSLIRYFLI